MISRSKCSFEIGLGDARLQLFLGVALGGVADHPLFVAQLVVEIERIRPVERQDGRLAHVYVSAVMNECRARPLAALVRLRHPAAAAAAAEALLQRQAEVEVAVALAELVDDEHRVARGWGEEQPVAVARAC